MSTIFGGPESIVDSTLLKRVLATVWNPQNNEIMYATCPADYTPQHNVHLKLDVTFADWPKHLQTPALAALGLMASEVESVLMAIETETRLAKATLPAAASGERRVYYARWHRSTQSPAPSIRRNLASP